jgi:hypothetical protein
MDFTLNAVIIHYAMDERYCIIGRSCVNDDEVVYVILERLKEMGKNANLVLDDHVKIDNLI